MTPRVRVCRYYYVEAGIGSPEVSFQLIVDTGSTLTYVPCADCGASCGKHDGHAPYDPTSSASSGGVGGRGDPDQ